MFFFVAGGSLDKTIGIGLVTRKRGLAAKGCYQLWSYGLNSGWSVEEDSASERVTEESILFADFGWRKASWRRTDGELPSYSSLATV